MTAVIGAHRRPLVGWVGLVTMIDSDEASGLSVTWPRGRGYRVTANGEASDRGPTQKYRFGSPAQTGVGGHQSLCYVENSSRDTW